MITNIINKKNFIRHGLGCLFILLSLVSVNPLALARNVSPFPEQLANISNFRGQNNITYYFYITGSTSGGLWGTGVYTDDSSAAKAAVHAGILADGQAGIVKITILPGQSNYSGSTAHGVSSSGFSSYSGSFSIAADDGGDNSTFAAPDNMTAFRGHPGEVYLFSLSANKGAGSVWGSNVYTDDSNLRAAAVHAGVLGDVESGVIRVVIVPGQSRYLGSSQHGVISKSYGEFGGSYALSNPNGTTSLLDLPGTPQNPLADPGNLSAYNNSIGGAYYFNVTGANAGSVWGSNPYTGDSNLAAASVHSGFLALNQTGTVKVTILPGQSSYTATTANGISSKAYGAYSLSYSVAAPDGGLGNISTITSAGAAGYVVGQAFNYQITATNAPASYNATGLPQGLSINQSTGLISGTPQLTGHFLIDLQVINSSGTSSKTLILDSSGVIEQPLPPAPTSTADCLFDWAETHIPELFNPATKKTEQGFGYVYRFYTGTKTYLGIFQGVNIHLLQLNKSTDILNVGTVEQFKPLTGCK